MVRADAFSEGRLRLKGAGRARHTVLPIAIHHQCHCSQVLVFPSFFKGSLSVCSLLPSSLSVCSSDQVLVILLLIIAIVLAIHPHCNCICARVLAIFIITFTLLAILIAIVSLIHIVIIMSIQFPPYSIGCAI